MTIDTFFIDLINQSNKTVYFYRQYSNCYKCPLILTSSVESNSNLTIKLRSYFEQLYAINDNNDTAFWLPSTDEDRNCSRVSTLSASDKSRYELRIDDQFNCQLTLIESDPNQWLWSLLVLIGYFVLIFGLIYGQRYLKSLWENQKQNRRAFVQSPASSPTALAAGPTIIDPPSFAQEPELTTLQRSNRFHSIDAFRGLSIMLMIFVNYGAGQYKWLQHVPWDGFQLADMVFPFFIFTMGMSIAISFRNTQRINANRTKTIRRILKRSVKLFLLGIIVNSIDSANISTIRIPGVLQRFALSYCIVALVELITINKLTLALTPRFLNYIKLWPQYLLAIIMIIIYSYLSFSWHFDSNCPVGYVGSGGFYDNISHPHCIGGAAHYLDELLFTAKHCYRGNFAGIIYDQGYFKLWHDPEGLLGTTNSIVLTIIGLQVGHTLIHNVQPSARFRRFGYLIIFLGSATAMSIYGFAIPVNKNLWSLSFVTLNGCLATIVYSIFHYLIDIKQIWPQGIPFNYPGKNSILLYLGHEIAANMFPFKLSYKYESHYGYLAENLSAVTIWLWISYWLSENDIFFTV